MVHNRDARAQIIELDQDSLTEQRQQLAEIERFLENITTNLGVVRAPTLKPTYLTGRSVGSSDAVSKSCHQQGFNGIIWRTLRPPPIYS
jgi:hypothetical protein